MNTRDVRRVPAEALARLMSVGAREEEWSPEELADIFRHQLSMPIKFEPGAYGSGGDESSGSRRIVPPGQAWTGPDRAGDPGGDSSDTRQAGGYTEPEVSGPLRIVKSPIPPTVEPALTFADALRHPLPDLEVLMAIKAYAKAEWKSPERQLPKELAISLYFLAIAAALARRGRRISNLDAAQLSRSFRSVLQASWIDGFHRMLLEEGMRCLEAGVVE